MLPFRSTVEDIHHFYLSFFLFNASLKKTYDGWECYRVSMVEDIPPV